MHYSFVYKTAGNRSCRRGNAQLPADVAGSYITSCNCVQRQGPEYLNDVFDAVHHTLLELVTDCGLHYSDHGYTILPRT